MAKKKKEPPKPAKPRAKRKPTDKTITLKVDGLSWLDFLMQRDKPKSKGGGK